MKKNIPSSQANTYNYIKNAKEYIPDSEDAEINDIEIIQKPKKIQKKTKTKKTHSSNNGIVTTTQIPQDAKPFQTKPEEQEVVEFVLGDFDNFHKIEEFNNYKNMISLTLINESITDIISIVNNLPNKENLKYLCLNENKIRNLYGINKLTGLEELQVNYNQIEKIEYISELKNLKKVWLCENQIQNIENLPINITNFWIANNLVEKIPENFDKYANLEFLNIAGNFISDLKDIFILEKIKTLKKLYLSDINFGENPICQYCNYRQILIHIFKDLEILDQITISLTERQYVESLYIKRNLFFNNKIRQNHKINKMLFQMMKTYRFFLINMKYHQISFFSQRQKMLEYAKYEKIYLGTKNETDINDIDKEIESSKNKVNSCLKICQYMNNLFYKLKTYISQLNDLFIVTNFYELESNGNFKLEPGNIESKWVKSCESLMKSRLPTTFLNKYKFQHFSIYEIYKITNKKVKFLYDSLYDNLIDETNKFGDSTKYLDFFFLLLPKDILHDTRKLMSFLFEDSYEEKDFILCNSFSFLDEQEMNKQYDLLSLDKKENNNFMAVICKCAYFEEIIEEIKGDDMSLCSIDEIIKYIKSKAENMNGKIIKLHLKFKNVDFYYFKLKGLVAPEYIVSYKYSKENEDKNFENNENGIISSFQYKLNMNNEIETIFNLCTKHLYNPAFNPKQYFCKETINKNITMKVWDFNELENNFLFFAKNSIITYLKNCFKYPTYQDYLNEINKINEKIREITNLKFQLNYMDLIEKYIENLEIRKEIQKDKQSEEEKVVETNKNNDMDNFKWSQMKIINLFNLDLKDEHFNDLLNKILSASLKDSEILNMTKNCESLLLCKNKLEKIDLNKILEIFPNLKTLDLSHNNISTIKYEINDTNKDTKYSLSSINISYNNISDFSNIITLITNFENIDEFIFFANPYLKEFENISECPTKTNITKEEKDNLITLYNDYLKNKNKNELIINLNEENTKINSTNKNFDYIYDCFSFNDKYHSFSDNIYFREKIHNESTYRTVILSKKKLFFVPTIQGGSDTQVLYVNLNKISKITNLTQFKELFELYIQNNKIKKIENLPESLRKLDISNNEISDLSGIELSKNLEWFNIENNNIKSIAKIIKLLNIKEIYCAGNYINNPKECCQLGKLKKLIIIDLTGNEVCRIVKDLRVTMIYYCRLLKNFNRINIDDQERVQAKEYFTGKLTSEVLEKRLGVGYNTFNLVELDLSSLKLKDEINLFNKDLYPKLTKLNLSRNIFKTFSIFGKLPYLVELNLNYNLFTEIFQKKSKLINGQGIFGLPNLESLEFAGNQLVNLNGIQFFKKLKILVLRENNLSKIDSINHMEFLTFLDVSFNKLRTCDRTTIGNLPSLQVFLCDNNYLKNINGFEKFYSIQSISFENNKIPDYNSLEKLISLQNLKDLALGNNPVSKSINYRNTIIRMFPSLLKLDGKEITNEEREMIAIEMQMDGNNNICEDDQYEIYGGGLPGDFMVQKKLISANYNYNIQRMQDKALKKVNFVQIGYMMPLSIQNQIYSQNPYIKARLDPNNQLQILNARKSTNNMINTNNINLPQIKNYNMTKPISSDSKKRVYKSNPRLNGSMNNLTNNGNNINYNNNIPNVNIVNKNIPIPRNNNRGGSIRNNNNNNNMKYNLMNLKKDIYGNNFTNEYSPSLNIEKVTPTRTGKNFNNMKNVKKYK